MSVCVRGRRDVKHNVNRKLGKNARWVRCHVKPPCLVRVHVWKYCRPYGSVPEALSASPTFPRLYFLSLFIQIFIFCPADWLSKEKR